MSLVNYDYDDSGDEDENVINVSFPDNRKLNLKRKDPENEIDSDSKPSNNAISSFLPKSISNLSSSLTKETVKKSSSGRIQIGLPSINFLKQDESDEDSDEDDKRQKRVQKSDKGSCLISMLPKPKNELAQKPSLSTNISSLKTTLLIPNSVSNRSKARIPVPTKMTSDIKLDSQILKPNQETDKQDNASKNSNYFFNFTYDDDDNEADIKIPFEDHDRFDNEIVSFDEEAPVFGPAKPEFTFESNEIFEKDMVPLDPNADITYKKFIASKFGEEGADDIKIVDVDMSKHMAQNQDWLKNITMEKPAQDDEDETNLPNSTARRKHQITFLAYQAKKREVELKNQWAQNRLSKSQTKAKYGF